MIIVLLFKRFLILKGYNKIYKLNLYCNIWWIITRRCVIIIKKFLNHVLETSKGVCKVRIQHLNGHWIWFKVKALKIRMKTKNKWWFSEKSMIKVDLKARI